MLKRTVFALLIIIMLQAGVPGTGISAQDPFRSPGSSDSTEVQIYPDTLPDFFLNWSRSLNKAIAQYSMAIKEEGVGMETLLSLLLAVVFGMLHVLGPGHGKLFTFSYIGSRRASIRQGLVLAGGINLVDSLSAALLVFGGYGLLSVSFSQLQGRVSEVIQIISYTIIIVFSLWHLFSHMLHSGHAHHHHHSHEEGHSHGPSSSKHGPGSENRSPWMLALSIGLIPCPVSTVIFLFGLVNNMVAHSVLLVAAVSLGGFISMALLTIALIKGRDAAVEKFASGWGERLTMVLEVVSMIAISLVAILLLLPLVFR